MAAETRGDPGSGGPGCGGPGCGGQSPEAASSGDHALYILTRRGAELAARLAAPLRAVIYANSTAARHLESLDGPLAHRLFDSLPELLRQSFERHSFHIFVCAAGIVVRCIAPLLQGKERDPAVLVLDQAGKHVISLLSGHLGQANACALRLAALLGAQPVITTATDAEDLPALDCLAKEAGLRIGNLGAVKAVSAALLEGEPVFVHDPDNRLGLVGSRWQTSFTFLDAPPRVSLLSGDEPEATIFCDERSGEMPVCVLVTPQRSPLDPQFSERCLCLHPAMVCAGIGCKRGVSAAAILDSLEAALAEAGLSPLALAFLASLDAKTDEPGLVEAAAALSVPLLFFSRRELAPFPVSSPSSKAMEMFGIDGVCEPAALAAAAWRKGRGELIRAKAARNNVTVALALRFEGNTD